ncbi:MAG: 3-dehydroquinate dehydratase [Bacteroidales bacterium]|nr:3-dehydroquinate dehydratase [Bacteroidales bacterium]
MRVLIINGPNLNLTGKREKEIYGATGFESFLEELRNEFRDLDIEYFQTNLEGGIIDRIQAAEGIADGIVLNAGGYTHTSVAISDAVRATGIPVVEVHISNIFAREDYRHVSLTGPYVAGIISGFGLKVYRLAILALLA